MFSERFNEISNGMEAALQGGGHPIVEKSFSGPRCSVVPEVFKFVFKYPCTMYSVVTFS